MDIPCAIIIAAFCLPDVNMKMEVKSDITGSTAVASFGEVRASIVLPSEFDPPERTALDKQLCPADYCIPYTARLREDASAVELLIGDPAGREHFVQIKGAVDQIAALSSRMSFIYEMRGRWERVALSEFRVEQPGTDAATAATPPLGGEPLGGPPVEGPPAGPPDVFADERTDVLPDEPPLPEAQEQPWPR